MHSIIADILNSLNKKNAIFSSMTGSGSACFGIFDEKEIYPYVTEGIGEDILPKNVDFDLIDAFEKVTDEDAALYTRKLAKEEGIFAGNSCGAAVKGLLQLKDHFTKDDVVVVLLHDSGSRYIAKIYHDEWMIENGFMEK